MCPVEPKAVDWRKGDKTKPPMHRYDLCICCFWYTPASSGGLYWTISRTTNFELAFSLWNRQGSNPARWAVRVNR